MRPTYREVAAMMMANVWKVGVGLAVFTACTAANPDYKSGNGGGDDAGTPDGTSNARSAIQFPPSNALTIAPSITIRGTSSDPDGIKEVRLNGATVTTRDGYSSWSFAATLKPGINTFSVEVEDENGNVTSRASEVTIRRVSDLLKGPSDFAVGPSGSIAYLITQNDSEVITVDLRTGELLGPIAYGENDGPPLQAATAVTLDPAAARLVVCHDNGKVLLIDLATGTRTPKAQLPLSEYDICHAVVVSATGQTAFVSTDKAIWKIDLTSGEVTLVSDATDAAQGPTFEYIWDLNVAPATDRAFFTGWRAEGVTGISVVSSVDLTTGERQLVSGEQTGAGPPLDHVTGIASNDDGSTLWVVDTYEDTVIEIETSSGDRAVISGDGVGDGPALLHPTDVVVAENGDLLTMSHSSPGIIQIDVGTGNRTVLASARVGSGPPFDSPYRAHIVSSRATKQAFVTPGFGHGLLSVSLEDGARAVIAEYAHPTRYDTRAEAIALRDEKRLLVAVRDVGSEQLESIDLVSGAREVVSSATVGTGPMWGQYSVAMDTSSEFAYIADVDTSTILKVDLASGNRTVLSSNEVGTGPPMVARSVCFDRERGRLLIASGIDGDLPGTEDDEEYPGQVFAVDLATGNRSLLSGNALEETAGIGPEMINVRAIALTPDGGQAVVLGSQDMYAVDLISGNRTKIAPAGRDFGPPLVTPWDISMHDESGLAFIVTQSLGLYALDLTTGQRVIVSR